MRGVARCAGLSHSLRPSVCSAAFQTGIPNAQSLNRSSRSIVVTDKVTCVCYRMYCSQQRGRKIDKVFDTEADLNGPFRVVYSYPNLFVARLLQWMKIGIIGITPIWILTFLVLSGRVGTTFVASVTFIMGSLISLECGSFVRRIACRVAVNDETNQVRISHLNFIGKRRDVIVDLDQVKTESTQTKTRIFLKANEEKFLLFMNLTTPAQREELKHYFGDFYK